MQTLSSRMNEIPAFHFSTREFTARKCIIGSISRCEENGLKCQIYIRRRPGYTPLSCTAHQAALQIAVPLLSLT
jgi:hypothetical protein